MAYKLSPRNCLHCGKEYIPTKTDRKFCTHECFSKHRRKPKHICCQDCGIERQGSDRITIQKQRNYLCQSCSKKRWWQSRRKNPLTLTCTHCHKVFPYRQSGGKARHFCSMKCRSAYGTVTKECPVCNKKFTVSKSTADRYINCSLECANIDTVYVTCKRCGKIFTGQGNEKARHYCSEECRRPPIIKICENCHKEFRIVPSVQENRRFCSFRCYRLFSGESGLERTVRLLLESHDIAYQSEYAITPKTVYDFYLCDVNVVLDVDGDYWHSLDHVKRRDAKKDRLARKHGYTVERVTEGVIMHDVSAKWLATILEKYKLAKPLQSRFPF